MQGPISSPPFDPSTYFLDSFDIVNETKTKEVHFSAYPKLPLINENKKNSELSSRKNEESQNCDNVTGSYNQVYMDAHLSRQLQNKESNSLQQRVDALIKKRGLLQNRSSSVNGHYVLNPCDPEHSIQTDPNGYDFDTSRQKHRKQYQTAPPMKITNWNK